jgi:hypothetical protein
VRRRNYAGVATPTKTALTVGGAALVTRTRAPTERERSTDGDNPRSLSPSCHRHHLSHAVAPISPHDAVPVSLHAAARQKKKKRIGS